MQTSSNPAKARKIAGSACRGLGLLVLACAAAAPGGLTTNPQIGVLSLSVNGQAVKLAAQQPVQLSPFPGSVDLTLGPLPYPGTQHTEALRIRCKLEGVDSLWQEPTGPANVMRLSLGFLDQDANEVRHVDFEAKGQSAGWTGSFETSRLRHRREEVVVPPNASSIWVVISSAGAPAVMGAYFIGNLSILALDGTNGSARELLKMQINPSVQNPAGWRRDGLRVNMAKVIQAGPGRARRGLAIVDDNATVHAQWNTLKGQGPKVAPMELLVLEWDEMFSIGLATPATVSYKNLRPGYYHFSLQALSLMGVPTGEEASLSFQVLVPFWRSSWFWVSAMFLILGVVIGGWRYWVSRHLQLENARLAQQQALESERFRIARDIHDDFGARVTQISLLSSAAQKKPGLSPDTVADFEEVSQMSRSLVGALYETVWAISPENDHLDSLATYLCQMANQMCAQVDLKCRLEIPDLPQAVPVSSSFRHNVVMTVKEAIHNVIKHAKATELQLSVQLEGGWLAIEVKDNGRGFDPGTRRRGSGLGNMERRITGLGGRWTQISTPGEGTTVRLCLQLPKHGGAVNPGKPDA